MKKGVVHENHTFRLLTNQIARCDLVRLFLCSTSLRRSVRQKIEEMLCRQSFLANRLASFFMFCAVAATRLARWTFAVPL